MPQNRHAIFIAALTQKVFEQVVLWGEAEWWPKNSLMQFVRKTGGEIKVGTVYRQQVQLTFGPQWDVRVCEIVPNHKVGREFLNGIFKGREWVEVIPQPSGSRVDYVMEYEIHGVINSFLWNIFFQRLHDRNLELILKSMRDYFLTRGDK